MVDFAAAIQSREWGTLELAEAEQAVRATVGGQKALISNRCSMVTRSEDGMTLVRLDRVTI